VPPPPEQLKECLHELEQFLHDRRFPPLVHSALCHYQFEAIHPFLDGNGRMGRLLILLLLIEQRVLPAPLLYISAFFEATREEYYRHLLDVSVRGAWREWVLYFVQGVALQAEDVVARIERITALLHTWNAVIGHDAVIRQLATNPYITVNKMVETLKVSYSTAQRIIKRLEAEGIVTKVGDAKRDVVYCAVQILAILEEPTKIRGHE
jgi:Fic family protein